MNHQPDRQASASAPTSVAPNPSDAPSASGSISRSELQQALIQSMNNMIPMTMASQSHPNSMQPPQAQSNSMQAQAQGQGRGLSSTPMDLVQQLLGNMNNNGNGNMNIGGASAAAPFAQSMQQPLSHGSNNNNNITSSNLVRQLVASLQAQQAQHQSQQQAQVQAAISRAFGPSAGAQQQMQQPHNGQSLFSQMQLAQAQGLISGNANLLSSLGGVGGDMSGSRDFQNPLMQWNQFDLQQRAAMNDRAGQEAAMKKQKTENCKSCLLPRPRPAFIDRSHFLLSPQQLHFL
ncbi:hypothetical protein HJC23_010769 [Cyclotella cryptica]|uniref:Uncharacterized protein n=1 Tax=Cyclotella cryptica TaxID=29204 RepID=A0ABD3PWE4_9STRA